MKRSRVETVTIKRRRKSMEPFGPMPAGEATVRILWFGDDPDEAKGAIREWLGDPRATGRRAQSKQADLLDQEIAERLAQSRSSARALGKRHCKGAEREIVWNNHVKRGVPAAVSASRIEKALRKARNL